MSKEIKVSGLFNKAALSKIHKENPLSIGDVLVSRKNERFTVTRIFQVELILPDGSRFQNGEALDIVGSNKGKVFTVYVN